MKSLAPHHAFRFLPEPLLGPSGTCGERHTYVEGISNRYSIYTLQTYIAWYGMILHKITFRIPVLRTITTDRTAGAWGMWDGCCSFLGFVMDGYFSLIFMRCSRFWILFPLFVRKGTLRCVGLRTVYTYMDPFFSSLLQGRDYD